MIVLVLGGARSGKSAVAERRVAALAGTGSVTYVATARLARPGQPVDDDLADRVARHRARRPAHWVTTEAGDDLTSELRALSGPVLLDSLGPWVAGHEGRPPATVDLVAALIDRPGDTVVVSDEVGLAVHPPSAAGRWFTDVLGTVNQAVAAVADESWLVVAGRVLPLETEPAWAPVSS